MHKQRFWFALGLSVAMLGAVPEAQAEAPAEADWSVGTGLGFRSYYLGGGLSPLGAPVGGLVSYGASLERRISGPVWLRVAGSGAVGATEFEGGQTPYSRGNLETGLRWALAELGPVELSGLLSAKASLSREGTLEADLPRRTWGLGAIVGLAVEHQLYEGISLRLAANLGELSWLTVTQTMVSEGVFSEFSYSSWGAQMTLDPSLELRFRF